ncbi:MAG TPA: phosphohydrolase [Synergistaceae bacterium]|nr:phosphohydrolase [Synergistaceae bacterium]HPJ25193.1 phosphohydrolase [Synergistaceae bacterium]HPQ36382.1 phosphohydrolase [Synergistaceae bacterium]
MMKKVPFIVSHTDLDGVAAAAVAWYAHTPQGGIPRVVLTGYHEVDERIAEGLQSPDKWDLLVLDLICQKEKTADIIDELYQGETPFLFDHHQTTLDRFGNRSWSCVDTSFCAARVYYNWIMEQSWEKERIERVKKLEDFVDIANDRDLWLGKREESRLWQALITLSGPWSVFSRLVESPSGKLTSWEDSIARVFVERQEERFSRAREKVILSGKDLVWVSPDLLEFGDVSDFCGLLLDHDDNPPRVVAVANRKMRGDWAISLRSRDGLAGKLVGLLKDGRKVRGGGHDDAAALYYPSSYREMEIRDTLVGGIRAADQRHSPTLNLGDLLRKSMES